MFAGGFTADPAGTYARLRTTTPVVPVRLSADSRANIAPTNRETQAQEAAVPSGSHRRLLPTDQVEIGCHVANVAEVIAHADRAAQVYRTEAACLAGVSLWRSADIPENSFSIAIGPTRCAIVHTVGEFSPTVARGPRAWRIIAIASHPTDADRIADTFVTVTR